VVKVSFIWDISFILFAIFFVPLGGQLNPRKAEVDTLIKNLYRFIRKFVVQPTIHGPHCFLMCVFIDYTT
jgi:hypothetical protein